MSQAKRWSHTGLEQNESCPKQFDEVRNKKRFPYEANTPEAEWGRRVHKAFEDRQGTSVRLPQELAAHEKFMARMEAWPGDYFEVEQQVALNAALQPTHFKSRDVWWSGIVDYNKVNYATHSGKLVDYKTGKRKPKWDQLAENALWMFAKYPEIDLIDAIFYWTQDAESGSDPIDRKVFARKEIPQMWEALVPKLRNLMTNFHTDTWPMKKSGLCNGWCPVTDCVNWKPKRADR